MTTWSSDGGGVSFTEGKREAILVGKLLALKESGLISALKDLKVIDRVIEEPDANGHQYLKILQVTGIIAVNGQAVIISPKFGSACMSSLLEACWWYRKNGLDPLGTVSEAPSAGGHIPFVAWFLDELMDFCTRRLRRDYRDEFHLCVGKAVGRPLISQYVQQCSLGRPDRLPSLVRSFDHCTRYNVILRAALHAVRSRYLRSLKEFPFLKRKLLVLETLLADVPLRAVSSKDVVGLPYNKTNIHYLSLHARCRTILDGAATDLDEHTTNSAGYSFLLKTPKVFEEILIGLLSEIAVTIPTGGYSWAVADEPGRPDPDDRRLTIDAMVEHKSVRIGFDAKYKDVIDSDDAVTPKREDVYQAAAYSCAPALGLKAMVLVYPKLSGDGNSTGIIRVTGIEPSICPIFVAVLPLSGFHLPIETRIPLWRQQTRLLLDAVVEQVQQAAQ